jgi:excisionase family DNA binding protein
VWHITKELLQNMSEQRLLRVGEFAASLRITPACVRRWIRERKISIVHVGRLVLIPAAEIDRIIKEGTKAAVKTGGK